MNDYIEQPFENSNKVEDKTAALMAATNDKVQRLSGRTKGITDGDTVPVVTSGNEYVKVRESGINGNWYDTNEVAHDGATGLTKSANVLPAHREQAARLLNIPVESVTQQDMYDVGNMQTIQHVSDLYRSKGEPRWEAPLIRNSVRPNLDVVDAPVDIMYSGNKDKYGRYLGELVNPNTGINLTQEAINDPRMNVFYGKNGVTPSNVTKVNERVKPVEDISGSTDYMVPTRHSITDRLADAPGAFAGSVAGGVAGVADFLTGGRVIGGENVDAVERNVSKALGYDKALYKAEDAKRQKLMEETFKGVQALNPESYKNIDLGKAKELFEEGVTDPILLAQSLGVLVGGAGVGGAGLKAGIKVLSKGDEIIAAATKAKEVVEGSKALSAAEKAAEVARIDAGITMADKLGNIASKSSGALGYGATITSDDISEYAKNNNGELPSAGRIAGMFAANTLAVALPEIASTKFALGMSKAGDEVAKASIGKAVGTALMHVGASGLVEFPQETIQAVVNTVNQRLGTEKYKDKSVADIVNDATADILGQGVLGAGGGVAMGGISAVHSSGVTNALNAGKEYVENKLGTDANEYDTKPSTTMYGRQNRFNTDLSSVEVPDEAKPAWTNDIAKHAGEVWLSEDLKSGNEYAKNPTKVFEDATEQIAKLNGIESDEGKDLIKSQIFKNVYDLTKEKDDKGVSVVNTDKANELMSTILDKFKGNTLVENEAERVYKSELEEKFKDIRTRLAEEGVNTKDLSNQGLLTEDELGRLQETLNNMRVLGSEKLTDLADSIGKTLVERQERLGSQEGTPSKPTRKTVEQVRNEIENIGFLTKGYKSLKSHKADIESYVTNEYATPDERNTTLDELETFVKSRSNKVDIFDRAGKDIRVRSVGELKVFAKETLKDTNKLMDLVEDTFKKVNDPQIKERLAGMAGMLDTAIVDLNRIVTSKKSSKADIELYRNLIGEKASAGDKKQLDEYLKNYSQAEEDVQEEENVEPEAKVEVKQPKEDTSKEDNAKRLQALMDMSVENPEEEVVEAKTEDTEEEVTEEVKEEEPKEELSSEDRKVYEDLIAKANSELEYYTNIANALDGNPELRVENENSKLDNQAYSTQNVKDVIKQIDNAIETHQKRLDRLKGDRSLATSELKVLDKILEDYSKELARLKVRAGRVQAKIENTTDEKIATEQRMKYSYILVKELKSLLKKLARDLKGLAKKIVEVTKGKYASEKAKQEVLKDLEYLNSEIARVENDIDDLKGIKEDTEYSDETNVSNGNTKLENERNINEVLEAKGLDYDQVMEARDRVKGLRDSIDYFKKKLGESNEFRREISKVLGKSVKENGSSKRSLTNRLVSNEDIMEIMPRIISENEYGREKVDRALATLTKWEDEHIQSKKDPNDRSKVIVKERFINQTSEKDTAILSKLGLDKMFDTESISEAVEKAVNVTSLLTIAEMVEARRLNGSQLTDYVDGAFSRIVNETNRESLETNVKAGKFVPISTYAASAGRRLLEELEIKLDTKNEQDRVDVTNVLGMIVIDNILGNVQTGVSKGLVTTDAKGKLVEITDAKTEVTDETLRVMYIDSKMNDKLKEYTDAAMVFEYAAERTDGGISFKPVVHKYGKLGRNSDVPMSNEEVDYLNEQGSIAWRFDNSFTDIWENEVERDVKRLIVAMLGTREELVAKKDNLEIKSALAKYDADALDIERMIMAYELANGNEFYIGWDYTVSNRNMMSNKMINPQNSKLSRFIISAKDMVNNLTDDNKDIETKRKDLDGVMLGIAQAFDMDPDKFQDTTVIEKVKSGVVDIEITEDGKYKVTAISPELQEVVDSKDTLDSIRKVLGVKPDHIMHVYQVVDLIRKIDNGGIVNTNLALEADGITNGMMSTVAQIGLNSQTEGYFIKCGTYLDGYDMVGDTKIDSHGKFKENGGLDFYQTPVDTFRKNLEGLTTEDSNVYELVNELVTDGKTGENAEKKWRSYLKPLVMVFAYGAGMENISYNGSKDLVIRMIKKAKTNDELVKMMKVFKLELDSVSESMIGKMTKGVYNLETGRIETNSKGTWNPSEELLDKLTNIVNETVSYTLSDAFNEEFKPIVEYREAVKLVNQVNFVVARQGFKNIAKEKFGTDKFNELSREQVREVKADLIEKGIYYGSNNTNGSVQDYFKTEQDKENAGEYVTVNMTKAFSNVYRSTGEGIALDAKVNKVVKKLASNVGAVGVIDIHSIDGSTMIKGHIKDVLNIFDALMLGTDFNTNNEQMKNINDVYYRLLMEHSILGNAVKKVTTEESGKLFEQAINEMTADERSDLKSDLVRIFNVNRKQATESKLVGKAKDVMDTLVNVDVSRRELVKTPASVKQYYVSDMYEGGSWNPEEPNSRYAVYSNEETEASREANMLQNMFNMLALVASAPKEDTKAKDDKIAVTKNSTQNQKKIDEMSKKLQC